LEFSLLEMRVHSLEQQVRYQRWINVGLVVSIIGLLVTCLSLMVEVFA
jgi:hypothetical protein